MNTKLFLAILVCTSFFASAADNKSNVNTDLYVELPSKSQLRGLEWISTNGKKFAAFLKVPYGQPPLGDQRFMPAKPAQPWEGVR